MILKLAKSESKMVQDILAADIGATKTNIAVCHWDGNCFSTNKEATYKTKDFDGVDSLIEGFIGATEMPAKICLAVAGPVQKNKVELTNVKWQIDGEQTSNKFNRAVLIMNDLKAVAYSLAILNSEDIYCLHKGEKLLSENAAIVAPGTGLGEAGLCYTEDGYYPIATEGGHCSFAPRAEIDIQLYRFLTKSFDHVSWERVVSGPGICNIYDFLVRVKEREEPSWLREQMLTHDKATVISENIAACDLCKETIDMFMRYLAEESANLVLKFKATGGLLIGGGIVPHLISLIHEGQFLKQFCHFGRFKNFLESVSVNIILNSKAALLGAAYFGIQSDHPC